LSSFDASNVESFPNVCTKRTNSGASSANTFRLPRAMLALTSASVAFTGARRNDEWKPVVGRSASKRDPIAPKCGSTSLDASPTKSTTKRGTSSLRMLSPAVFEAHVANVDQLTFVSLMTSLSASERSW